MRTFISISHASVNSTNMFAAFCTSLYHSWYVIAIHNDQHYIDDVNPISCAASFPQPTTMHALTSWHIIEIIAHGVESTESVWLAKQTQWGVLTTMFSHRRAHVLRIRMRMLRLHGIWNGICPASLSLSWTRSRNHLCVVDRRMQDRQ